MLLINWFKNGKLLKIAQNGEQRLQQFLNSKKNKINCLIFVNLNVKFMNAPRNPVLAVNIVLMLIVKVIKRIKSP